MPEHRIASATRVTSKSRFESVAALTGLADSDLNFEREILNLELLSTVILGLSR